MRRGFWRVSGQTGQKGGRIATFLILLTFSLLQRRNAKRGWKVEKGVHGPCWLCGICGICGRGVLYTLLAVSLTLTNPITSLDNDPCTLVILIHSFFLLSLLINIYIYIYTLSILPILFIRSGNVFITYTHDGSRTCCQMGGLPSYGDSAWVSPISSSWSGAER